MAAAAAAARLSDYYEGSMISQDVDQFDGASSVFSGMVMSEADIASHNAQGFPVAGGRPTMSPPTP